MKTEEEISVIYSIKNCAPHFRCFSDGVGALTF